MESSNQEHFFETDTQQAKRQQRAKKEENTFGNPLRMPSKILAVVPDPKNPHTSVFAAESGGRVSRINTESRTISAKYTGPSVPVTCLATGGDPNGTIFAGSWDKTVWSWDIATRRPGRRYDGHSDFVKAIVCARLGDRHVLVSGGADKKIIVWDVETGRKLHTLQDPTTTMMSLQSLAVDPVLSTADEIVLVSASSDPHIRRWRITAGEYSQLPVSEAPGKADENLTIQVHETSVYKVLFDVTGEEVDLWTASADGTAKCLLREKGFASEDAFEHGDFVRAIALTDDWVITGGMSQVINVWDRTSGELYCAIDAHFDEITDLVVLRDPNGRSDVLCSVGIDCTLRTWPLDRKGLDGVVEEIRAAAAQVADGQGLKADESKDGLMTAEEEAELAALMEDD
ncbi:putative WD repeat-containing protein [Colletotrichum chlorophyti]|uniref:Putative WD repeat-containing protein n=1 Tax=Colletotrichum chlorophyti TaxID=708187 RepID=A0A1Q8RYP2_9PEZI|nr:putative WD repeat-containing protein [Colletotrichum chlorophyti]